MKIRTLAIFALFSCLAPIHSGETQKPRRTLPISRMIDLGTALRLAGAENVDVKLAREREALAHAEHRIAQQQYLPWLTVGAGWRGHQENIQAVDGQILDVEKTALDLGAAVRAQLDLGETYYRTLAARQLVRAAEHASDAQRQEAVHAAALAYFDLLRLSAYVDVNAEAVRISEDYGLQVRRAVEAGIAFAGDAYRIETQLEINRLAHRRALEAERIAAARLAQILRLDPATDLHPAETTPAPLRIAPDLALGIAVATALERRPELRMNAAQREAARQVRNGAKYGPWVPSITGQYSYGGLAGGRGTEVANFDENTDYGIGLAWRIGPGGLFDRARVEASESRLRTTEIEAEKLRDEISRQVVESHTRMQSLRDQMAMAQRALTAAQKTLDLSRERKEFGVGAVAETIQSEQDLTRARRDYLGAVAEYNKAQYSLQRAMGAAPAKSGRAGK